MQIPKLTRHKDLNGLSIDNFNFIALTLQMFPKHTEVYKQFTWDFKTKLPLT